MRGGSSSVAMAAVRVLVAANREVNSASIRRRVQGLSPIPAPDRLITASALANACASSRCVPGSQRISAGDVGSRRTRVVTSWPASRSVADKWVPISPEAPAMTMCMIHLTTARTPTVPSLGPYRELTMIER